MLVTGSKTAAVGPQKMDAVGPPPTTLTMYQGTLAGNQGVPRVLAVAEAPRNLAGF